MRIRGSAGSATPALIVTKKGKRTKFELKQVEFLLLKKERASSLTMSRKRKEVLAVKTPFDRMGCKMEKVVIVYQHNFLIKSMDKFVVEREMHVKSSHRNHVMDRKNLVMIWLVFYEVTHRWVEKGPDKDQGGERDGDNEKGSEEEDEESGDVEPIPILNNDTEVNDEFAKERGFKHSGDGEERGGDVNVGMRTMQKDMDCLLKKATDVANKSKLSRHIIKEFVDRMDPMVDECERAFYE
ncbi:hypothetical protein Syun_000784 [Stephania yunnanensis]|uniref:Uncharacterized protein n=1 Tax=Stephania yunnanensis TaxID=152371 RepID=A0AAP0LGL5_9MAGN